MQVDMHQIVGRMWVGHVTMQAKNNREFSC
jgi:hypothetical protein